MHTVQTETNPNSFRFKTGKSPAEFSQELIRINQTAKDYIAPVGKMVMDDEAKMRFNGAQYPTTGWADQQLASYLRIPTEYYNRIRIENPSLLARNVNHGLGRSSERVRKDGKPESRMLRTLDGKLRAVLSSKYRRLDSFDLMTNILPVAMDHGLEIASAEITERRVFAKMLSPRIEGEIKKGDVVQYGLMISGSDVGYGAVLVEPFFMRLICTNGAIAGTSIRKKHIGKNQAGDEDILELCSDETKAQSDKAFWMQVRDVVVNSLKPEVFNQYLDAMRQAANDPIRNPDLERVVELSMKATGVTGDANKMNILQALASGNEGAGMTRWGLLNSFTKAANADGIGYEMSTDLQRAGGEILELAPSQWKVIAAVA